MIYHDSSMIYKDSSMIYQDSSMIYQDSSMIYQDSSMIYFLESESFCQFVVYKKLPAIFDKFDKQFLFSLRLKHFRHSLIT